MGVSAADLTSDAPDRVCPSCGAGNLRTSAACYRCGASLWGATPTSAPPPSGPLVGDDRITIRRAWHLGLNALRLVGRNRSLLVFPLVGSVATFATVALLGLGLYWLHPDLGTFALWAFGHPYWPIAFAVTGYVTSVVVSMLALAGLVGASVVALEGRRPTVSDGWRVARTHLGSLLAWSLLDATVGLLLQLVTSRMRVAGAVLRIAGGIAWGISTYFVVQVLVLERQPIPASIARSARIIRYLFGDVLFSDIVAGLLAGAGVFLAAGAFVALVLGLPGSAGSVPWIVGAAGGILAGTFLLLLGSTTATLVQTGLFRYAVTGRLDPTLYPGKPASRPA
jgi:hypothetical protein